MSAKQGSEADEAPGVGGPRSAGTRQAIARAARELFAANGYDHTTIRAVGARAGVDPSMVMRYFGSKAGLFTVATSSVLEPIELTDLPVRRRGEALARHFVERWEAPTGDDTLMLIRTATTDPAVAAKLQDVFNLDFAGPVADLGLDDEERRVATIGAQLLGLALCRYLLHFEPISSLSAEDVIATLGPVLQRSLC